MFRVLGNGSGDQGSIPSRVIRQTWIRGVLNTATPGSLLILNTGDIKI